MIQIPRARSHVLAAAAALLVLAGCSSVATPAPSKTPIILPLGSPTPTVASTATSLPSQSPASSGSDSSPALALPHLDLALETRLPDTIGNIPLEKFSLKLSSYVASSSGGDKTLYAPWLLNFQTTPDDVYMAIASDLTQRENFAVDAIDVPGATDAKLASAFGATAHAAGWPVSTKTVASKSVLQITDPNATGPVSVAYVFAKDHVLYIVLTDDADLLVEALIKLP